jgi:hypothetical protein
METSGTFEEIQFAIIVWHLIFSVLNDIFIHRAKALFNFQAEDERELSFQKGELKTDF